MKKLCSVQSQQLYKIDVKRVKEVGSKEKKGKKRKIKIIF